jgi:CxxC motif-containing protein (DUF1111 family)
MINLWRFAHAICGILLFSAAAFSAEPFGLEVGEQLPGGQATQQKSIDRHAYSYPSASLSLDQQMDFRLGKSFFKRLWVTAPSSTQAADGLGPLYNARSCMQCHVGNGRGQPIDAERQRSMSLVMRLSVPDPDDPAKTLPEPTYGSQLQSFAIAGHTSEGEIAIDYQAIQVALANGDVVTLHQPSYTVRRLAYGPLDPTTRLSPRLAPQMIGLGLLEAIDEAELRRRADPDDRDGDGISGQARSVWSRDHGEMKLGRFGWKASVATVNEQSQHAFNTDIGISVPLYPNAYGDCSETQRACQRAPDGNSPQYENLEVPSQMTKLVSFYAGNLAVPPRRHVDDPRVLAGKRMFHAIGCTACHQPSYATVTNSGPGGSTIWPYTDLLLHDMGDGLSDRGGGDGREWRTAPLWGIGLSKEVNGNSHYLHDGRAGTLLEAILWHGGEAQRQRDAVVKLNREQRENLIRFVESL